MKPSFSIVIPAFNEEENLEDTAQSALSILDDRFSSYEIIIVNDGSSDRTREIAERLARTYPCIKILHHRKNQGLGASLRDGYRMATKEYVTWFTADNGMPADSVAETFDLFGKADLLIPYMSNPESRPLNRQIISRTYTGLLNFLFGLKIRYFNGGIIYRTEQLKHVPISANGFASLAEPVIYMLKSGHSCIEIPQVHRPRVHGHSKAFRPKNIVDVFLTIVRLFWRVRIKGVDQRVSPALKSEIVT